MIDKFFKPISDLIGKAIPDKNKRMEKLVLNRK